MRNVIHLTVLTAFSTVLGFVPLTVNAQAPNQVIICGGEGAIGRGKITFNLNGKGQAITGKLFDI